MPVHHDSTGPLLALRLDRGRPLGLQVEEQIRSLVRSGRLPVGTELPATRVLAADLGVSRGVVVRAYAQLAAEGYIALRPGDAPLVAARAHAQLASRQHVDVPVAEARFNLSPNLPDLALFPRADWAAAQRAVLHEAPHTDFAYGEPFGALRLRSALASFLARTRGAVTDVDRVAVTSGSTHALFVLASVLRSNGAKRVAVEDPGHRWRTRAIAAAGLEVVPVPVDGEGLAVEALPAVDSVLVSPDHNFPLGVALSPARRRALVEWATASGGLVIEHDFDGHFRYDRPPAAALHALAPDHVAYVGGASALLAPAVRLGWAVVPERLVVPVANHLFSTTAGTSRIAQLTLAELVERGRLDRHLRRARAAYRRRRALAVRELERCGLACSGSPVGLFLAVSLPEGADEAAVAAEARRRGIALDAFREHGTPGRRPGLAIGFAASPEPTLARALKTLAAAWRAQAP